MGVQSYRDLEIWKRSMDLVAEIYLITKQFPKEELYTLTSQIRRAAISIPSNIAEGRSKRSTKDYMRFLNVSYGSLSELETQLMIGQKLGYIASNKLDPMLDETANIGRMINGLLSSLDRKLQAA